MKKRILIGIIGMLTLIAIFFGSFAATRYLTPTNQPSWDDFTYNPSLSHGLTYAYKSGSATFNNTVGYGNWKTGFRTITLRNGTITLNDDSTNYLYINFDNSDIEINSAGIELTYSLPLAKVQTNNGNITSVQDCRTWLSLDYQGSYVVYSVNNLPTPDYQYLGKIYTTENDNDTGSGASYICQLKNWNECYWAKLPVIELP
jgi:hypothetical protein